MLDDQTKQILARSVARSNNLNHRVKWDPNLCINSKTTASNVREDIKGLIAADKDENGQDILVVEKVPEAHYNDFNYKNLGFDASKLRHAKESGVITGSKGKLKMDNAPFKIDEMIQLLSRAKKQSYNKIDYNVRFNPEESKGQTFNAWPHRGI